jgi:hypothetical protein
LLAFKLLLHVASVFTLRTVFASFKQNTWKEEGELRPLDPPNRAGLLVRGSRCHRACARPTSDAGLARFAKSYSSLFRLHRVTSVKPSAGCLETTSASLAGRFDRRLGNGAPLPLADTSADAVVCGLELSGVYLEIDGLTTMSQRDRKPPVANDWNWPTEALR